MEFFSHDKKKVLWEVVEDHFVEEPTDHEEIGLWGLYFNFFDEDEEGFVIEGSSEFPYVLMLINIWPGNWNTQFKRTNQKVDEENGKSLGKVNVQYQKVHRFPEMNFGRTLVVLFQLLSLVLGGQGCGRGRSKYS